MAKDDTVILTDDAYTQLTDDDVSTSGISIGACGFGYQLLGTVDTTTPAASSVGMDIPAGLPLIGYTADKLFPGASYVRFWAKLTTGQQAVVRVAHD